MIIDELLADLARNDIELFLEGDRLRYRARKNAMTPRMRAVIAEHRAQIISRLDGHEAAAPPARRCTSCNRRNWVDAPPKDGRIRTTCSVCGRFIGYRPVGV